MLTPGSMSSIMRRLTEQAERQHASNPQQQYRCWHPSFPGLQFSIPVHSSNTRTPRSRQLFPLPQRILTPSNPPHAAGTHLSAPTRRAAEPGRD